METSIVQSTDRRVEIVRPYADAASRLRSLCRAGVALWLSTATLACAGRSQTEPPASPEAAEAAMASVPSLSEKYAPLFPLGAAVDSGSIKSHEALLERHFNSITAENEMKFESLEATEGVFDYSTADAMVALARSASELPDRQACLMEALTDLYAEHAAAHGWNGGRAMLRELLGMDIELNAQGLLVWLDRQVQH